MKLKIQLKQIDRSIAAILKGKDAGTITDCRANLLLMEAHHLRAEIIYRMKD